MNDIFDDDTGDAQPKTLDELSADEAQAEAVLQSIRGQKAILTGERDAKLREAEAKRQAQIQDFVRKTARAAAEGDYRAQRTARDDYLAGK